jgi:hypothetical protein
MTNQYNLLKVEALAPILAEMDTKVQAAKDSADKAELFDGPKFDTIALMALYEDAEAGDVATVLSAFNAGVEHFDWIAGSTLTADGALVVDGVGGQWVSKRTVYADWAELDGDVRPIALNTTLTVYDIGDYKVVSSGQTLTTSGGLKLSAPQKGYGVDVRALGAPTDGVTDASVFFQALANRCDAGAETGVFVPNNKLNFHLDSPIVFTRPDVKLWGVKGAGYHLGANDDKGGNFVVGASARCAIDFGDSAAVGAVRTGQWNVANIGIKQAIGVTAKTKNGLEFTSAHNGPHRGAIVRELSANDMNAAIFVKDPGVSVSLATLVIENSVMANGNYGLLSAGNVLGMRFVGNQCEQNSLGAIHGTFSGPIKIQDNMLEGQPNTINIQPYLPFGNRPFVDISSNYFEANSGDYVAQVNSSSTDTRVTMKDNFRYSMAASDYLRLRGSMFDVQMFDEEPVTLTSGVRVSYGSRIVGSRVPTFELRGSSTTSRQFDVALSDYSNLLDAKADHVHALAPGGASILAITPYGERRCCANGETIGTIAAACAVGDLVVVNALCRLDENGALPQLFNQEYLPLSGGGVTGYDTDGRWALISYGFRARDSATSMDFRFISSTNSLLLGVAVKNYGAMTTDESAKIAIRPCLPNLA